MSRRGSEFGGRPPPGAEDEARKGKPTEKAGVVGIAPQKRGVESRPATVAPPAEAEPRETKEQPADTTREKAPPGWMTKATIVANTFGLNDSRVEEITNRHRKEHPEWFKKFMDRAGKLRILAQKIFKKDTCLVGCSAFLVARMAARQGE